MFLRRRLCYSISSGRVFTSYFCTTGETSRFETIFLRNAKLTRSKTIFILAY